MKRFVRPSTAADIPSILGLFDEAGLHPNFEPEHLQWKYWQPRADWPGPRSFVLTDGSGLSAHGAVIPGWCAWGTHRIKVVQVIDWAALPRAVGAGVALMKHIGQQTQAMLSVGGSAHTRKIQPHIGFRPAGVVTGYVRTLFPMRLRSGSSPPWKLLPRFARSVAWTLAAPAAHNRDWQVRRLASDEIERVVPVFPAPTRGMAVLERSVELFRYMLSCPVVPMALFGLERAGRARGYFLLASAPGQVRIADCWMDSDDPADWRGMILCAVAQAKHDPQAAEVVIWANEPVLVATLAGCGFHPRYESPVQVRPTDEAWMPPLPLRVQMLDSDGAYFHEGRREYWA
jgi:hypothetical protein